MTLHLFPQNVSYPQRTDSKRTRSPNLNGSTPELKGVAFEMTTTRSPPAVLSPAKRHIKHSLAVEPPLPTTAATRASPSKGNRPFPTSTDSPVVRIDTPLAEDDEDRLSALPENTSFGATATHTRLTPGKERPLLPLTISTEVQPSMSTQTLASPGGDSISPLPTQDRFITPLSPRRAELAPRSAVSTSPAPTYRDSPSNAVPPYSPGSAIHASSQSIFPRYDHNRPLDQQQYYPRNTRATTPTLPREQISKINASPIEKRICLQPLDLTNVAHIETVVDGYEHMPVANNRDLQVVHNASYGQAPGPGRKILFRLIQPRGKGTSLGIGTSADQLLYSMDKTSAANQLTIRKHLPNNTTETSPVAQLTLPDATMATNPGSNDVISIFPQQAAIEAIQTLSTTPLALSLAASDPTASSPQARRLAQDAVWEAHRLHRCLLVRAYRKRDSLGAVIASYKLNHPSLGDFPITITKSLEGRHARDPRAKISLHHPSATPAAVEAETLVLAFLDFGRDAFVFDMPGLLALEGRWVVDSIVSALFAVAVVENEAVKAEQLVFAPPPSSPLPLGKDGDKEGGDAVTRRGSKLWRRVGRKKEKKKRSMWDENGDLDVDLATLTHGALALMGLSFKMAVWTVEFSARLGVGVVVATAEAVRKP